MATTALAPSVASDELHIPDAIVAVHPESVVTLLPVSIVADGDGYIVGNIETEIFLALPEVGVVVIRALADGHSVSKASAEAAAHAAEPVDVVSFVEGLVDAGLVAAIDGVPIKTGLEAAVTGDGLTLPGTSSRIARLLFSTQTWVLYALLACFSIGLFIARPGLWPSFNDVFFHPNLALCLVTMTVLSFVLPAGHEVCHWLAARSVGVGARLTIGRRHFFPVFDADLSGLWTVPRHQRYGSFLAGMAYDVVILSSCLAVRWTAGEEWVDLPPLLVAFLGAVVLRQVLGLAWQTFIFLRTDLYAAVVVALGCYQLQSVTRLTLRKWAHRLRPQDRAELEAAHPRDVRAARWFAPLTLIGLSSVYFYLVSFLIPGIVFVERQVLMTLMDVPFASNEFWQALTIGLVIGLQFILPLGIFLWQRVLNRQAGHV